MAARRGGLPEKGSPRLIHDEIRETLKRFVVASRVAPGASVCVGRFGGGRWQFAAAAAGEYSTTDSRAVDESTLYDLASLTKPYFALGVARLVRAGRLEWNTPLGELLPMARRTESERAELQLLLAHRAGLQAHVLVRAPERPMDPGPLRGKALSEVLRSLAGARRRGCEGGVPAVGFPPLYSDLGYILLGVAVSLREDLPLDELLHWEVGEPLQLGLLSARRGARELGAERWAAAVAPTEDLPHRGGVVCGAVHDDNAWALSGLGLSGHAGLFGTAQDVARLGAAAVDALRDRRSRWLRPQDIEPLLRPRPGGALRAGFDGKAQEGSSAGAAFGEHSFGHLGFTGTSVWCDPAAQVVVALLTNRVHPTRENIAIRGVRPELHSRLFQLATRLNS